MPIARKAPLPVRFFRTEGGSEPVRDWLLELPEEEKKQIGRDLSYTTKKQPRKETGPKKVRLRSYKGGSSAKGVSSVSARSGRSVAKLSSKGVSSKATPRPAPKGARSHALENPRTGSSLDEFLREEGLYEELAAAAIKETIAWQIGQAMKESGITKSKMAEQMRTSRAQLDRLLDPENKSVTLSTLFRAATVLGVELRVELVAVNGE